MITRRELGTFDPRTLPGASVGRDVSIRCVEFEAVGPFRIGDGTTIEAERIVFGAGAEVGKEVTVRGIREPTKLFSLGDHALIDERSNVLVPHFSSGDYTRIFRNTLISGYKAITLGHNCWVGQNSVLNSAERLTIGNNVRIGGSQIWTHVASGELLEGSRFYNEAPVTLEDDVWLVGMGHMISPGITLARATVVMSGSALSKSTEAYHTYSGVPAKDITEKLPAWNRPSELEKWGLLTGFVHEFLASRPDDRDDVLLVEDSEALEKALRMSGTRLVFARAVHDWSLAERSPHTVFDLSTKTYLKRRTSLETAWHHFAIGFRARFIPRN